jgi:DNA repair exonuclease SbcCD ATPase subunit
MLLGCTEFTKLYIQIKENPWPFVNLVKLVQNAKIGEGEVVELLRIANGYLPRIRLEYDRFKEEINFCKAELNSWKSEVNNAARTYQLFCDRNLALKNREDELQHSINELDSKKAELEKTTTRLKQQLAELQENNAYNDILNLEVKQDAVISTDDVLIPQPVVAINSDQNENETLHYPSKVEPSSGKLIFDTKDLF